MKYEFKGTKGDWSVDGFDLTSVIVSVNEVGWKHLCRCNYGYVEPESHFEENTANAHLIAAAPDLLDACIEALDLLDNLNKHGEPINYNEYSHYHDVLSSAIHKALNIQ